MYTYIKVIHHMLTVHTLEGRKCLKVLLFRFMNFLLVISETNPEIRALTIIALMPSI